MKGWQPGKNICPHDVTVIIILSMEKQEPLVYNIINKYFNPCSPLINNNS